MTDNYAGENRKIRKGVGGLRQRWVWLVALCCLLCNRPVFAGDSPTASPVPTLDNIGFVKNPEALHHKFPMCDAFLKVEWVDTQKKPKIGYSQYEIIMEKTGEKKMVWALITLSDKSANYLDWNVYNFKHASKLDDLFAFVRRALIVSANFAMVLQDGKRKETFHRMNITNDASIAGYSQTICLAYPDEKLAWIVEGKSAKNGIKEPGLKKDIERARLDIGITYKFEDEPALVQPWLFDINYDNKIDLVWTSIPLGVIYSVGEAYYSKKRRFEPEGSLDKVLQFPPLNKECFVRAGIENLTTDGKNYYFGKECNITKLTSVNDKE